MEEFFSQFHLIRPLWLIALIPAFLFFILLLKRQLTSARWHGIIDENLMPHVLDQMPTEQSRWPLWFVLLAWILTCIALAGPTWKQLPQPVQKKEDALVIVLDMSLSMAAQDVSPDRATRARQKIIDILNERKEGLTALVVYAGDAYTVTPLTDDSDTIINLVPALSPFIMPAMGSRPDKALLLAQKLIEDSGLMQASYLLITDGIQKKDIPRIKKSLGNNAQQLSVLTLGTESGAPIAMQGQGFKRDSNGEIVLPKLDLKTIKELASTLGIRWHQMSYDDRDWNYLLDTNNLLNDNNAETNNELNNKQLERQFDLWADEGYWLLFIIICIAAFSYRQGWLLSVVFLVIIQPQDSMADFWTDAWQTKDQQGQAIFQDSPKQAAELFENSEWKGSSYYRAQDYQQAAENFIANPDDSQEEQAVSHFNRGNALAHTGDLDSAIKAYEQALALDSSLSDAEFNKSLLEQLKDKQEQQDSNENKDSDNSQKDDSEQNNSDSNSDEKSEENNSEDQESENNESEDQQSKDQNSEGQSSENQSSNNQDNKEQNPEHEQSGDNQKEASSEPEEKDSDEQSESSQQENTDAQKEKENQSTQVQETDSLSNEEKQALKQWLNRVPDDPGGLLKRKFLYQYKQREHQDEGEVSW